MLLLHINMIMYLIRTYIAAGSHGECWGNSGAPLVTHSNQPIRHFILAGMVEADDCGSKAPYVSHIKVDGYQEWITNQLYP